MPTFRTVRGRSITLAGEIGHGAEGTVYDLANSAHEVVKVYRTHQPADKRRKIRHMVGLWNERLAKHAAWPLDLVDDGTVAVVMPKVGGVEIHDIYGPKSRMQRLPHAKFRFLVTVAYNLCAALHEIHAVGAIVGDFNQRNILVNENAVVSFVDCDSFQITAGNEIFRCLVGTPDNLAPEAHGTDFERLVRTQNHDCFTLAVLTFQLLFVGRHPYAGVGGHDYELPQAIQHHLYAYGRAGAAAGIRPPDAVPSLDTVPSDVADLFERAFSKTAVSGGRPSASEWGRVLRSFLGGIVQCRTNHSHEYSNTRSSCPWCDLYSRIRVSFFVVDAQHAFSIDALSIKELADRLLAMEPVTLSAAQANPPICKGNPTPDDLDDRGSTIWFGVLVMCAAAGLLLAGVWLIAIPVAIWAWSLISKDERPVRRAAYRAKLDSALKLAQNNKAEIENKVAFINRAYIREHESTKSALRRRVDEYRNLPTERQRQIENLKKNLEQLQIEEFLDRIFISHASIPGIGAERKSRLRAYGVETAADIPLKNSIPGFGPHLRASLDRWRNEQLRRFRFNPSLQVDPREIQKVDEALLVTRRDLERQITTFKDLLVGVTQRARSQFETTAKDLGPAHAALDRATMDLAEFNRMYPAA